jgi:hypothetical protein
MVGLPSGRPHHLLHFSSGLVMFLCELNADSYYLQIIPLLIYRIRLLSNLAKMELSNKDEIVNSAIENTLPVAPDLSIYSVIRAVSWWTFRVGLFVGFCSSVFGHHSFTSNEHGLRIQVELLADIARSPFVDLIMLVILSIYSMSG